jgi:methylglutaconyl-CoA hydratase
MMQAIDGCPAPVIVRAHGYVLGGGSGLVACADVAVAAPDAVFGFTEVKLGIIPAVISPFVLPRIGAAARRLFVTGERFGADTALRIGLVDDVSADPDAAVDRILGELATAGPEAARAAKRLVREGPRDEATTEVAARLRTGAEGQEGLRAFLEKRAATWRP